MNLKFKIYNLQLRHVFRIARGEESIAPIVIVELHHDGIIGYGEAAPSSRYGESVETVVKFYHKINLAKFNSPFETDSIMNYLYSISDGDTSAKCGIDLAIHDWIGKKLNISLSNYFGFDRSKLATSSFTIGMDSPEMLFKKIKEADDYPILKIKLGSENDEETIKLIRKITDKPLCVDANEGWKDKNLALERIKFLEDQNILFVEQPMPANQIKDTEWLREKSNLPLIADENVLSLSDISQIANAFDGINIKLMKCTGIREAMRMIHTAQGLNLKIMMGCMIESSIAISAGAQLLPMLNYPDLDGNVLITNDPFDGLINKNGNLLISNRPGLGVEPNEKYNSTPYLK